jgi:hypothetical protein
VAVDSGLGVEAGELARVWNADAQARGWGSARAEVSGSSVFLPGPAELIVIPLAVNLASTVVYDVVRRLVTRLREGGRGSSSEEELEVIEHETDSERLVVVRLRRSVR